MVFERRLRLKDFFENLHHHFTNRMTLIDFHRALDSTGFRLSKSELDAIADKYRVDYKKEHLIDYVSFVKEIESGMSIDAKYFHASAGQILT